jgi:predicted AAA+ superfamily ATPase
MKERYLMAQTRSDLAKKMVFVGGPRQVGKTTMAKGLLKEIGGGYLNWDIPAHRHRILKGEWPVGPLWIFDELHKYRLWRNLLKGLYDDKVEEQQILVTGSARLDYYRFSGDSLQGRYHYLRLHPLSMAELHTSSQATFMDLLKLGGFPEPFFGGSEIAAKRWSKEYRSRLIQEDLTPIERIQDIGSLELLSMRLPDLVGSPLSINALREDLQISHKTISRWVDILERLYSIFRLSPLGAPKIRAVKKEQKHYQMDWTLVPTMSLRFENLVACHLLKWTHFEQDCFARDLELRYFRDIDGREVDFVILENRKPIYLIECKWSDVSVEQPLSYLKAKFPDAKAYQLYAEGTKDYVNNAGIRVCSAAKFLAELAV